MYCDQNLSENTCRIPRVIVKVYSSEFGITIDDSTVGQAQLCVKKRFCHFFGLPSHLDKMV